MVNKYDVLFLCLMMTAAILFAPAPTRAEARISGLSYLEFTAQQEDGNAVSRSLNRFFTDRDEDENLDDPAEIGWFVGPMFLFLNYDIAPFEPMTSDRGLSDFETGTFVWGIMAGLIRYDLRFGALYLTGGQEQKDNVDGRARKASIGFQGAGMFVEWNREFKSGVDLNYPARIPYFREGYLAGLMTGAGWLDLRATGPDLGPTEEWKVEELLYVVYPYVGFWSSPYYEWLWIQVDIGYLYFRLDPGDSKYVQTGTRMVQDEWRGGIQVGLKITVGDNPNIIAGP